MENSAEILLFRDASLQSIKISSMASAQEFRLVALLSGSGDFVESTAWSGFAKCGVVSVAL